MAFNYHAADGPLSKTIALRVTDNDGNITTTTSTLTIDNVAPTITLNGSQHDLRRRILRVELVLHRSGTGHDQFLADRLGRWNKPNHRRGWRDFS